MKTSSGPTKLFVEGVRTCGLANISAFFMHRSLNVLTGSSGAGKTALAVHTLYAESLRRVSFGLSVKDRRRTVVGIQPEFSAIRGLIPAVYLNEYVSALPGDAVISSITGIEVLLKSLSLHQGRPVCSKRPCSLTESYPESLAKEVVEELSCVAQSRRILVGALFSTAWFSKKQEEARVGLGFRECLMEEILGLRSQGRRRFVIGERVFRLARQSEQEGDVSGHDKGLSELVDVLGSTPESDLELICVLESLDSKKVRQDRLSEALRYALSLGTGAAVVIEDLSEAGLPSSGFSVGRSWRCVNGYFCPNCKRELPLLNEFVLSSLFRGGAELDLGLSGKHDWADLDIMLGEKTLSEILSSSLDDFSAFVARLRLEVFAANKQQERVRAVFERLEKILQAMLRLGLGSLSLDRQFGTLSTGEKLKAALASISGLDYTETLIIADEPSRVLHPKDMQLVYRECRRLVQLGNSVIVVEQIPEFVALADHVVQLETLEGGAAGSVVFQGSGEEWVKSAAKEAPGVRTSEKEQLFENYSASLVLDSVSDSGESCRAVIPAGCVVSVVGPSGAGKTCFFERIAERASRKTELPESRFKISFRGVRRIEYERFEIGTGLRRSKRGSKRHLVWDYAGLSDDIAVLYSELPQSRRAGLSQERFALRVPGGACPSCGGTGKVEVDLEFVGTGYETCDSCLGKCFEPRILENLYQGLSIGDVLELSVAEAGSFFSSQTKIAKKLEPLGALGLGHLRLGEVQETLPGGIRERIRLGFAAVRDRKPGRFWLFEQPFAGCSQDELKAIFGRVKSITQRGEGVLFTTHNPSAIFMSDYVLEFIFDRKINFFGKTGDFALDKFLELGKF